MKGEENSSEECLSLCSVAVMRYRPSATWGEKESSLSHKLQCGKSFKVGA